MKRKEHWTTVCKTMIKYSIRVTGLKSHLVKYHGESLEANTASISNNNSQNEDTGNKTFHHNLATTLQGQKQWQHLLLNLSLNT